LARRPELLSALLHASNEFEDILYSGFKSRETCAGSTRGTLSSYCRGTEFDDIPTLQKLSATHEALRFRVVEFVRELNLANGYLNASWITGDSVVGGGRCTNHRITNLQDRDSPSDTVSGGLRRKASHLFPARYRENLRRQGPSRLRTVSTEEEPMLLGVLSSIRA